MKETTMDDFAALRAAIKARGWYRKTPGRVVGELVCHLILACGGIVLFLTCRNPVVRAVAMLVSTVGSVGVGTNTHTSSHYATSNKRWANELLTYFGYPLFLQLSATYWWHKHVVVHHPAPNVIGIDRDIDFSPWFVLTQPEAEQSVGGRRLYCKLQWLVAPLAIAANSFSMQVHGWWHVLRMLCTSPKRKTVHWIDLGMLLLHWVLWVGILAAFFPVVDVLFCYIIRFGLLGYAFFFVLAPAHFPAEAVCAEKSQRRADLVLGQTVTTLNFRTGYIGRFLCSGLDYQIEHHLFPNVSHVFYPKMSGLVKEFCRRQGYPYRTLGWGEAIWKACLVFRRPKTVEPCLEAFRLRPQREDR